MADPISIKENRPLPKINKQNTMFLIQSHPQKRFDTSVGKIITNPPSQM